MKVINDFNSPKSRVLLISDRIPGTFEFLLVLLLLTLPPFSIIGLPALVPVHFNADGQPDGFGSRLLLLIAPVSGILLYAFLKWIATMKKYFNYPIKINAENRLIQEELILKLIRLYCFKTLITFNLLTIIILISAKSYHVRGMGMIIVLIFMAYLLPLPLYIRKANKLK